MRKSAVSLKRALSFAAALAFACLIFGAIPWLSVPTLGQAVWASGFAQSYANAGGFAIYATDFGLPTPAPIAFGLSGTFVQGLLIRAFGLAAIDAYTITIVAYLALALYGAMNLARVWGASYLLALVIGLLWLSLPVVWNHAGFSMLALGFALLPFYLYSASSLLTAQDDRLLKVVSSACFCFACIVSVFMDGYTFVMFFVACAVLLTNTSLRERASRKRTLVFVLPSMLAGFVGAYFLYMLYIGGSSFQTYPMEVFRGWGADVAVMLEPTRGINWLWDATGLSAPRDANNYWGDASVLMTSFIAPVIVTGICGFIVAKRRHGAGAFLAIAVLGIYLSLGPSLKVDSTKLVPGISQADSGALMPEKYALGSTGSAWISKNVPGFRNMRAAYRWVGLGALGLWALTALLLVHLHGRRPGLSYAFAAILIASFLPHIQGNLITNMGYREKAVSMVATLGRDLHTAAGDRGTLFFAPHGNDFIANYLAATGEFKTYNIGGDKNVEMAQLAWSQSMLNLDATNLFTAGFRRDLRSILLTGLVDAVVLPYLDTLTAAQEWPPSIASVRLLRDQRLPIAQAAASSCFQIREFPMFVAVSLTEMGRQQKENLLAQSTTDNTGGNVAVTCGL